ncbi:MAG: hypothetical protein GXY52_04415 [Chloroflexi bacterium]|nr:hypothetical protein [Chloroflexota bacterium]
MQTVSDVLVLYNAPLAGDGESDVGILEEVAAVCSSLNRLGIRARILSITCLDELAAALPRYDERVVINLVEYLSSGIQDASLVPAVCRAFGRSCTGNGTLALMLGLDKQRAKALFAAAAVRRTALAAWHAIGCRDYARVDFRLEGTIPYVLEINPNPDISPDAGFTAALSADGLSYDAFIETIVSNARARLDLPEAINA